MQFPTASTESDDGAILSVLFQWVCCAGNFVRLTNWFYHRWRPKKEHRCDHERECEANLRPFVVRCKRVHSDCGQEIATEYFVLPSIARKRRGIMTVPTYTRIVAERVRTWQRVRDPRMGTHLFQQTPSTLRTHSSLQILWAPPLLPTPKMDLYPQRRMSLFPRILATVSGRRIRPTR